ncbi:MAG: HPr family phosphocarrier protein [Eubacteriales bacterium]
MSKVKVVFNSVNEVNDFVNIVNRYSFDMKLGRGDLVIGATSILGIVNLGISNKLDLHIAEDAFEIIENEIKPYIVE